MKLLNKIYLQLIGRPILTDKRLKDFHYLSYNNKRIIDKFIELDPKGEVLRVGCFYCKSKIFPGRIREYTKDNTAICPVCHIDSLIPLTENAGYKEDNILEQMNKRYFGE